jgi:hypothetical protein
MERIGTVLLCPNTGDLFATPLNAYLYSSDF